MILYVKTQWKYYETPCMHSPYAAVYLEYIRISGESGEPMI
jgi:hypothetical protein